MKIHNIFLAKGANLVARTVKYTARVQGLSFKIKLEPWAWDSMNIPIDFFYSYLETIIYTPQIETMASPNVSGSQVVSIYLIIFIII